MLLLNIFIIFINIGFSLLLLTNVTKNRANIFFFLTSLFLSIWVLANYFIFTSPYVLFWNRFATCCSCVYSMTTVMFILDYPKQIIKLKWPHITGLSLLSLILVGICSSPFGIKEITSNNVFITDTGYLIFTVYFLTLMVIILGISCYGMLTYEKKYKRQLRVFFIGLLLAVCLACTTNLILPAFFGIMTFFHLGPIFATIFTLSTTYSLLKYQFFDVTVFINKTVAHVLGLTLISTLYISLSWLLRSLLPHYSETIAHIFSIIFLLTSLPFYTQFRLLLQSTTEKLFLKGAYNYQETLLKFSSAATSTFTLQHLEEKIHDLFLNELEIAPTWCFFPQGFDTQKELAKIFVTSSKKQSNNIFPNTLLSEIESHLDPIIEIHESMNLPTYLNETRYILKITNKNDHIIALILIGNKLSEDTYSQKDFHLLTTLSSQISTLLNQIKQTRVSTQIDIAHKIQHEIIPSSINLPHCNVETYFESSEEVGGDYYDTFSDNGNHWIISGDVSGHGVGSGLVMFMVQSIFSTLIYEKKLNSPAELNYAANKILCKNFARLSEPRPMTLATLHTQDGTHFSCHGSHENIYLYKKETKELIHHPMLNIPLGIGLIDDLDESLFSDNTITLNKGDRLFICTDGIIEAENTNRKEFGEKKLTKLIKNNANSTIQTLKTNIISEVKTYTKNVILDDISFIIIEKK